jgi:AcrR family transcriptional regulator
LRKREDGFEEVTFVLIAKEAGFSRSNLYKYFNDHQYCGHRGSGSEHGGAG